MPHQKKFSVRDLLLAVLHGVSMESVPENMLIQIGEYMGLSMNAVKESLKDLIDSKYIQVTDDMAYYIRPERSLFSQHFEQWRLSEQRRVVWDGSWLVCELPNHPESEIARKRSLWALNLLGFKQTPNGMIRANNLLGGIDALGLKLSIFGVEKKAELLRVDDFPEQFQATLKTEIWPIEELNESYIDLYNKVEAGFVMLKGRVTKSVLVYALKTGYEAIRLLAIDPLLPEEMQDPSPRIKLTRILKDYEALGKKYWEKVVPGIRFN